VHGPASVTAGLAPRRAGGGEGRGTPPASPAPGGRGPVGRPVGARATGVGCRTSRPHLHGKPSRDRGRRATGDGPSCSTPSSIRVARSSSPVGSRQRASWNARSAARARAPTVLRPGPCRTPPHCEFVSKEGAGPWRAPAWTRVGQPRSGRSYDPARPRVLVRRRLRTAPGRNRSPPAGVSAGHGRRGSQRLDAPPPRPRGRARIVATISPRRTLRRRSNGCRAAAGFDWLRDNLPAGGAASFFAPPPGHSPGLSGRPGKVRYGKSALRVGSAPSPEIGAHSRHALGTVPGREAGPGFPAERRWFILRPLGGA
jgi:hypothetical protein